MAEPDESTATALAIMREWRWWGGDPDGNIWPVWKGLSDAVNQLAMEGISRPKIP